MKYTSPARFLGLPLVDIRIGSQAHGTIRGLARGWIAVGDVAVGIAFSLGGAAVGGVALGGLAVGILPLGGLAVGVLAMGGAALGVWSIGGASFGLHAALGGLAVAIFYAQGGAAFARHANDPAAAEFFSTRELFPWASSVLSYSRWLLFLLPLLPFFLMRRRPST